jgi:hypothetical protein
MATSGAVSFTITAQQIVNYACKVLGKLADGDSLTTNEYNDCLFFLNALTKQWISRNDYAPGIKMWTRARGYQFLSYITGIYTLGATGGTGATHWTNNYSQTTSGGSNAIGATTIHVATTTAATNNMRTDISSQTSAISIGQHVGIQLDSGDIFWTTVSTVPTGTTITIPVGLPSASNNIGNMVFTFTTPATPPQVIESVQLRDNQSNDTPVQILTLEEYMSLPSKQAPNYIGDPIAIYYEPHLVGNSGQGYGLLHTDVAGAQDTSKVLVISYLSEIEDFVSTTDEMYFPKEWGLALIYALARVIAPMFNATWTQEMQTTAMISLREARNSNNKKTSLGFIPGARGGELQPQWR